MEADLGIDFALDGEPEAARPVLRRFFERLTREVGLNTFEVNLEGWDVEAGSRGRGSPTCSSRKARARGRTSCSVRGAGRFETARAEAAGSTPRWFQRSGASTRAATPGETHVLYQVQKVPERTCRRALEPRFDRTRTQRPRHHSSAGARHAHRHVQLRFDSDRKRLCRERRCALGSTRVAQRLRRVPRPRRVRPDRRGHAVRARRRRRPARRLARRRSSRRTTGRRTCSRSSPAGSAGCTITGSGSTPSSEVFAQRTTRRAQRGARTSEVGR